MSLSKEYEYRVVEKVDEKGCLTKRTWHHARQHSAHRQGGPAVETFDPETGKRIGEIWINNFNHGKHRENDLPAEITIDPKSGIVTFEMYYQNGRLHRDHDQPAEIHRDGTTGHITCVIYAYEGYEHRVGDLPAVQEFDPDAGKLMRSEYYCEGERHRDKGPAIVEYDLTGVVMPNSLQFYRNGQKINSAPTPKP